MLFIERREPTDEDWKAWRTRAVAALDELKRAQARGEPLVIKDKVYKDAIPFLFKLTNGRCAYCESKLPTQPPDLEHYRPKGRVREDKGLEGAEPHPGYWWLAYEWTNMLPSCIDCNRVRYHPDGDNVTAAGKGDHFPIKGTRARTPEDSLENEVPLLLDPLDPRCKWDDHFEFSEDGRIRARTEFAEETLKMLGLNLREQLVSLRAMQIRNAAKTFKQVVQHLTLDAPLDTEDVKELNEMWDGATQYGTFARIALRRVVDRLAERGLKISLPLEA